VRIQLALPDELEVLGADETSEGGVEIEYRGIDALNLPVQGRAACTFAVGEAGSLTLLGAVVDGTPLDEAEVAAVRRALAP
jgi:hypothetical protein